MTDIVFVHPPLKGAARYGALAAGGIYMPPLGLGYLAAVARGMGLTPAILDCQAVGMLDMEEATRRILALKPRYLGISSVTLSIRGAAELAERIRKHDDRIPILLGGCHVTAIPEETMEAYPVFDVAVLGEGEGTLADLLAALDGGGPLSEVKGIVYREGERLVRTAPRADIERLDEIPRPAWDLYPDLRTSYRPSMFGFKNWPTSTIITSRGCPYVCSFCDQGVYGHKVREHSIDYAVDMMLELRDRYGMRDIIIYDDTFTVDVERVAGFCEELLRRDARLTWYCNGRVDRVNPEVLGIMARAGCWLIGYGVEAGSQPMLDFMQKGETLEQVRQACRWTKAAGIRTKGSFIVGAPGETRETLEDTRRFIMTCDLDILVMSYFTPFPGTLDDSRKDAYGVTYGHWDTFSLNSIAYVPHGLTVEDLEHAMVRTTREFYLRPKILKGFAYMAANPAKVRIFLEGALGFARFHLSAGARRRHAFQNLGADAAG